MLGRESSSFYLYDLSRQENGWYLRGSIVYWFGVGKEYKNCLSSRWRLLFCFWYGLLSPGTRRAARRALIEWRDRGTLSGGPWKYPASVENHNFAEPKICVVRVAAARTLHCLGCFQSLGSSGRNWNKKKKRQKRLSYDADTKGI